MVRSAQGSTYCVTFAGHTGLVCHSSLVDTNLRHAGNSGPGVRRWLAVAYVFFGVAMVLSLVFIPFVPQALKLAMCV